MSAQSRPEGAADRPVLDVRDLAIAFDGPQGAVPVVHGISFVIGAGEIVGLVGESGSGKTLTSLAILGLLPPNAAITGGSVRVGDTDLTRLNPAALRRLRGSRISMIFQDPIAALDPVFTCGDQIVETILMHEKVGRDAARRRAIALLEKENVKDPERVMRSYPHELSGGQCQRVMIAMAVACNPEIIIADEPTTALDVTVQKQVLDILKRLNADFGAAILLITHDLGVIYEVADRVLVMYGGRLLEEAVKDDLFARPRHDYTKALLDSMPTLGDKRERLPVIERDAAGAVRSVVRPAQAVPARTAPRPDQPLLEIRDLVKTYWVKDSPWARPRAMRAVGGVSLSIPRHSTLGLVGESGCGKSTLSRLVMRLIAPDSGSILFEGTDITRLGGNALFPYRRRIAMVFQNPYGSLNPRQTIGEAVAAPLVIHGRRKDKTPAVARLLDAVGLPRAAASKYPHEFSGGQRQRIAIARALALQPDLVICDEAVSALDVSVQAQVLNLLKDLQAEFDLTYLFISHDLAVVENISDTVAVMEAGLIVEQGRAEDIFARPAHAYTRNLLDAVPRIETLRTPEGSLA